MSFSYVFYYVESNIICLVILGILLYKNVRGVDRQERQVLFDHVLVAHMLYFANDCIWALVDGAYLPRTAFTLGLSNVFVYLFACVLGYYWFLYAEVLQGTQFARTKRQRQLAKVPLIVAGLAIVAGYAMGYPYYTDLYGNEFNSTYYYALLIVPFGYALFSSVLAFARAGKRENFVRRRELLGIAAYPLFLLASAILQAMLLRVALFCVGSTLAILIIYLNSLDSLISLDPLTQLNNRNQLTRYLDQISHEHDGGDHVYLIMLDLDRFKEINDRFGHTEGDHALQVCARALRSACGAEGTHTGHRHFLARYGGDEFIIAAHVSSEAELVELCDHVRKELARTSQAECDGYTIETSMGWAEYNGDVTSAKDTIDAADEMLYEQKRGRR